MSIMAQTSKYNECEIANIFNQYFSNVRSKFSKKHPNQ